MEDLLHLQLQVTQIQLSIENEKYMQFKEQLDQEKIWNQELLNELENKCNEQDILIQMVESNTHQNKQTQKINVSLQTSFQNCSQNNQSISINTSYTQIYTQQQNRINEYEKYINQLQASNEKIKSQFDDLNSKISEKLLEIDNINSKDKQKALENILQIDADLINCKNKDIQYYQQQYENVNRKYICAQDEYELMKERNNLSQGYVKQLEAEIARLNEKLKLKENNCERLQSESKCPMMKTIQELKDQNQQYVNHIHNIEAQYSEQDQLNKLQIINLMKTVQELQDQNQQYVNHIKNIEAQYYKQIFNLNEEIKSQMKTNETLTKHQQSEIMQGETVGTQEKKSYVVSHNNLEAISTQQIKIFGTELNEQIQIEYQQVSEIKQKEVSENLFKEISKEPQNIEELPVSQSQQLSSQQQNIVQQINEQLDLKSQLSSSDDQRPLSQPTPEIISKIFYEAAKNVLNRYFNIQSENMNCTEISNQIEQLNQDQQETLWEKIVQISNCFETVEAVCFYFTTTFKPTQQNSIDFLEVQPDEQEQLNNLNTSLDQVSEPENEGKQQNITNQQKQQNQQKQDPKSEEKQVNNKRQLERQQFYQFTSFSPATNQILNQMYKQLNLLKVRMKQISQYDTLREKQNDFLQINNQEDQTSTQIITNQHLNEQVVLQQNEQTEYQKLQISKQMISKNQQGKNTILKRKKELDQFTQALKKVLNKSYSDQNINQMSQRQIIEFIDANNATQQFMFWNCVGMALECKKSSKNAQIFYSTVYLPQYSENINLIINQEQ
ncbi:Hypothetical_protein [Hexamita inflata]|uniref:Hypothetical_protein n=1 Tax=Hexamita inflata TaxID=28002 RepID=A0AA86RE97_9EUKA|nr:Hypothetical protein HINF_LOCUS62487 [Hexamita inflata]